MSLATKVCGNSYVQQSAYAALQKYIFSCTWIRVYTMYPLYNLCTRTFPKVQKCCLLFCTGDGTATPIKENDYIP